MLNHSISFAFLFFCLLAGSCEEQTKGTAIPHVSSHIPKEKSVNPIFEKQVQTKQIPEELPVFAINLQKSNLSYNGIPFQLSKDSLRSLLGEPDSIARPMYECGPFSEEWEQKEFYQYFYGTMNFILWDSTAEIQNIEFSSNDSIEILGKTLRAFMPFDSIKSVLTSKNDTIYSKNRIDLLPARDSDEWYYLEFEDEKMVRFDRFEPC